MGDTGRSDSNWNMSQMVEDSQNGERVGRKPKTDRTRRSWSTREEEVLLLALKDLVVNGWKSDNGFRAGGVGFNHKGDHKIDCDNDQWEQIVKVDNNARYMRFKSCPMFDEWKDIFGKDRATGFAGQDLLELYHDVSPNINVGNESQESQFEASDDARSGINPDNNMGSPEMPNQSTGNSDTGTQLPKKTNGDTGTQFSKKTGKKRKIVDRADALLELLAKGQDETNARLDKLASRIGYEFDVSKARKEVFAMLGAITGITLGQQLDAAEFILSKVEHLNLFMCLPEAFHHAYVLRALEKNR
ncbi:hypothetical protein AAHA92_07358 [Salvia divinorum]|uniref:Myb/SANT-like domain-containing protein n=1 Tax=Salvia divinorum TaxID=28513 RepID=A0ABD1I9Q9_SALDI